MANGKVWKNGKQWRNALHAIDTGSYKDNFFLLEMTRVSPTPFLKKTNDGSRYRSFTCVVNADGILHAVMQYYIYYYDFTAQATQIDQTPREYNDTNKMLFYTRLCISEHTVTIDTKCYDLPEVTHFDTKM